MESAPEQSIEAVPCMTGTECWCQRALCTWLGRFTHSARRTRVGSAEWGGGGGKLNDFQGFDKDLRAGQETESLSWVVFTFRLRLSRSHSVSVCFSVSKPLRSS